MKKKPSRLIIYAPDVQNITGRNIGTCYRILKKVRIYFGKKTKSLVTIPEFAEFMDIPEELVREFMIT